MNDNNKVSGLQQLLAISSAVPQAQSQRLLEITDETARQLEAKAHAITNKVDATRHALWNSVRERSTQSAFSSWRLTRFNTYEFDDIFEVLGGSTSKTSLGHWNVESTGGRVSRHSIVHQSVTDDSTNDISFLRLRDRRFYDFVLTADVRIIGGGATGLSFKMKDGNNMFLFEMNQVLGLKRLVKVVNGQPLVVVQQSDGGYLEDAWYTVRVECRQARITILVTTQDGYQIKFADVLDDSFVSGSIGFMSSAHTRVSFDNVAVDVRDCVQNQVQPPPPLPEYCSLFKEGYAGHFATTWHVITPHSDVGEARWRYGNNIGHRHKVIVQSSEVKTGDPNETPSIAILKGHRQCRYAVA
eukprot:GHVQ01036311.1.p1 GENE.GHVQ01036311.1~~GHVQ01036311.1.p1  ORF type:complete len:356 (-),score=32.34 GHVQ01036311.1:1134-2201(-)